MTEEKYEDKVLNLLSRLLEASQKPPNAESSKHEELKGHKDLDEQLACPTCKGKLLEKLRPEIEKDLRPAILKEVKEKLKSPDNVICEGCGEIVKKDEESCPSCHGKAIRRW